MEKNRRTKDMKVSSFGRRKLYHEQKRGESHDHASERLFSGWLKGGKAPGQAISVG